MASFRTGFKIFGEISLKQGLGRIRSFSEDRKPGQWLPEDQWAVRQPGSTCPDPCEKPKKPPKPSKSWLSVCKDPEPPIECDVRHNNCPSPPVKGDAPWYSLDNLIPKKKPEKTPPLQSCREEMKRREVLGEEEEVCEHTVDKTFPEPSKPELPECCMPKPEPCPAPVVTLSCPLPKELDIMLWCGRPCTDTSRIAIKCQSDKLPYQEFRPQKCWKPPPFSLPVKGDPTAFNNPCCTSSIAYAEFKQVEVPKPLYTRYKSVELSNCNLLLCMTEVKCPDDGTDSIPCKPPPPLPPPPLRQHSEPVEQQEKVEACPEKPVIEAASCKPVKIKKASKYTFQPKPTKLIEKRVFRNPCAQHKTCNLQFRPPEEKKSSSQKNTSDCEPPKVITGTLTTEPQTYERNLALSCNPPRWMYMICKPGSKKSPLMPAAAEYPKEPDWCSETDGLKFYDGKDDGITPKPPPDPCLGKSAKPEVAKSPEPDPAPIECPKPVREFTNRFVLMPEKYCIKNMRPEGDSGVTDKSFTFEKFIEAKTATRKTCSKSYPQMKENILYDLQRLCPNVPIDPSKLNAPCRKPPEPACPRPPTFCRGFATFSPSTLHKLCSVQLCKTPQRTECGDTSGKCKPRDIIPKPKPCPEEKPKPSCADIALPCCPKVRMPPACDAKKPMPLCKKKLPPKPSFSECSKDPPPCPKMTECNCWEKLGNKNRKFSDWAAKRTGALQGKPRCLVKPQLEGRPNRKDAPSFPDSSDLFGENEPHHYCVANLTNSRNFRSGKYSSNRSQYAGKVKCYTLKSVHTSPNTEGNRLMLGLKDPKVDSYCEYEQRSIVTRQKKPKTEALQRDSVSGYSKPKKCVEPSTSNITVQDQAFRNETCGTTMTSNDFKVNANNLIMGQGKGVQREKGSDDVKERENSVTLYSSEQNEENSKAFMGSIGSWINDLFNVPSKRPCGPQKSEKEEVQKDLVLEEDTEYLRSINTIKEQFRKKLKSETSVHLSNADRPFEFHFDKVLDNNKKSKKRVRSMPSPNSSDWLEELNSLNDYECLEPSVHGSRSVNRGNNLHTPMAGLNIRTIDRETAPRPHNSNVFLGPSNLVKKKRKVSSKTRPEISKLEEYVLPSPAELSKRILLNINDQEKCLQFYKNSHLGVQEAQHYGARKSKPCQSNTRCYTTNANVTDSPENSRSKIFMTLNRHTHCCTGDASEMKAEEDILSNKSPLDFKKPSLRKVPVKNISDLPRDTLSFTKIKSAKSVVYPQIESLKSDPKATSDDLVKYLMKKVKVSSRSQHGKRKGSSNVPQIINTPKSRFMQSATNSLVMSAMARKEIDSQVVPKIRGPTDKALKSFSDKEVLFKYPDGNIRFDVSRALNSSKFNRSTYLIEDDKSDDNSTLFGKDSYKNTRRPYEDLLKKDPKKNNSKITKRQEVKQMLSKLDMKFVLNSPKMREKEYKKKLVKTMLDNLDMEENRDVQNPRFLKQHELFKNNTKAAQQNPESVLESVPEPTEKQEDSPTTNSLSTELALINPNVQLALANLPEKNVVVSEQPEQTPTNTTPDDNKITEFLAMDENSSSTKSERKSNLYREKLKKKKTQNLVKESENKGLLNSLPEYYSSEISNQKEIPKPCEPTLRPPDLCPMKSTDLLLLNRRYSTKTLTDSNRADRSPLLSGYQPPKCASSLTDLVKDSEDEKKEEKEKKKVKTPKNTAREEADGACGFEMVKKKPGPNCDANEANTR